ncbi:MAG: DUF2905 domain-containing protein [Synechococcales cyanobacterium C42_A2020_086]|jgi:H+/Cl- antiporter ClcA|nr:DUF2905 domain-containing protein [Synechococcales cyanobacterium C42_A2020_086]
METLGKLIFSIGGVLVLAGLCLWLFADQLSWLGKLPGDIRIERPNFRFYLPLTSMLLASALVSAVLWVLNGLNGS